MKEMYNNLIMYFDIKYMWPLNPFCQSQPKPQLSWAECIYFQVIQQKANWAWHSLAPACFYHSWF